MIWQHYIFFSFLFFSFSFSTLLTFFLFLLFSGSPFSHLFPSLCPLFFLLPAFPLLSLSCLLSCVFSPLLFFSFFLFSLSPPPSSIFSPLYLSLVLLFLPPFHSFPLLSSLLLFSPHLPFFFLLFSSSLLLSIFFSLSSSVPSLLLSFPLVLCTFPFHVVCRIWWVWICEWQD